MNDQEFSDGLKLRKQVEKYLRKQGPALTAEQIAALSPSNLVETFHELQVHQIELEMQNEELRQAQIDLDAGRARYFDLYDLAPVGYFTLSDKDVLLEVNLAACTLLGGTKSQLVARPFTSFIRPEDTDRYYLFFRRLLLMGQPQVCGDIQVLKRDGTRFWAALQGNLTTDATGAAVINLILSDITTRKQAEAALRDSESQLQATLESTADGLLAVDSQGKVIKANRRFAELWHIPSAALESHDDKVLLASVLEQLADPTAFLDRVQALYGSDRSEMDTLAFKDGRVFERYSIPLWLEGRVLGRVWSFRDVTARKRAEAELRLQGSALAAASNAIVITDPKGNVLWVNPAFTTFTGYAPSEVLGQSTRVLKSGEQDAAFYQQLWETIRAGQVWSGEIINKRKDGSLYTEEMTITPLRTEQGEISHFIAIKQDITARKQAETARLKTEQQLVEQERLRVVGQLAAGIAHDFNNTLSPIVGFSELLLKDPAKRADPVLLVQWLQYINTAATDAASVVRQIRELSHAPTPDAPLVTVDLNRLIEQTMASTQPRWKDQAQAEGRTLNIVAQCGPIPLVTGEEYALREVLTNLLLNAVDFTPNGGTITLGTAADEKFVRCWVSDTGAGMTEETRRHCCEPFFTTKGPQGTGLGLAMVQSIVQRYGGTVAIASVLGQGTTVTLQLPIATVPPVAPTRNAAAAVSRVLRVLVVDDEPMLCEVVTAYLTVAGHLAETVTSGAAALQRLVTGQFDLVLTDLAMPQMNGEQLAAAIHAHTPALPVILMTGFGEKLKAKGKMPAHISAILSKPITEESLSEALAKVFPCT